MKKLVTLLWLGVLLPFASQCQNDGAARPAAGGAGAGRGEPIVRWHFAGRAAIARDTNATRFKLVDMLAITADLRAQVASNLSRAPGKFWEKELPAGVPNGAALLRPLFDDLLQGESFGEVRGPLGRTETALAIELADDRARLWSTNLWQLLAAWKQGAPRPASQDGATGWELKRAKAPNVLQFWRAGKWVVLTLGQERLTLAPVWLQQIKSSGRPAAATEGQLAEVQIDSPTFGKWFPLFTDLALPPLTVTMRGRGEHIRTEAKLRYPQPLVWKYEPWQIPTNLVGEPMSSFTVARGVAPLVGRLIDYQSLNIGPPPNQVCLWGITNDPCRIYFGFPVADAIATVKRLSLSLPPFVEKSFGQYLGDFFYASNRNTVIWGGLPYIQPYVQPATNAGRQFVHGGIFPLSPRHVPVPPELFTQIGTRTNLLYYDWEITPFRMLHGQQLYQILNLTSRRVLQPANTPVKNWLMAISKDLAKDTNSPSQTVTEITQTAPNELTLTRRSHLGFTGFEMATFSAWLDSPAFPFAYEPPKVIRVPKGTNTTSGATNKPAAAPKR